MKRSKIAILLLSAVVLVAVAGCGLLPFGQSTDTPDTPAETPAVEVATPAPESAEVAPTNTLAAEAASPTATPEPVLPEEEEVEIIPSDSIFDLPGINSYRSRISWYVSGPAFEEEDFTGFEMLGEHIKDQQAQRIVWGEGEDSFEMIQIGDRSWVKFGESWMESSAGDIPDFAEGLSWFSMTDIESDIGKYKKVGREVVNGFNTTHYTFDETTFRDIGGLLFGITKIDKATGDIYLADEGFVVKSVITLEGIGINEDKPDLMGAMHMEHELSDINAQIVIEPPAMKTLAETFGFDIPLPEGAKSQFVMEGMATYSVGGMSVTDAVSFYKTEMETLGFVLDDTFSSEEEDSAFFIFKKDETSINVSISQSEAGVEITFMSW